LTKFRDLPGAACMKSDPRLFDPDCHHHARLGSRNACWLCEEARDVCEGCPVLGDCFKRAQETKESFMIMAGLAWSNGRPRHLTRRRS
jgi:hypothetical protein